MENKSYYIKGIAKTLGTAALSVIVALMIAREIGGESLESFGVMAALAVACVPFGWSSMRSITAGLLVWGWVGILVYYLVMLAGSAAIGLPVMAYRLIKDTAGLVLAVKAEKNAATDEEKQDS